MKKSSMSRRETLAIFGAAALPAQSAHWTVYIGTYTHGKSKGIYSAQYADGKLSGMDLAAETESPSFLALHPNRRFLYAVNELDAGTVSAFAIGNGGKLKFLNRVSSHGAAPCHLDVDKTGKCMCVANYTSGNVAVFPVHADGTLGEISDLDQHHGSSVNKERQSGPHAHESVISKNNRFLFVPDLGLDRVMIYNLDPVRGKISDPRPVKIQTGSGPRHMAFHPNGRYAYVLSEMGGLITAFQYHAADGALESLQTISTLPKDYRGFNGSAEIEIHPNGRFLYASNRGPDTIALFHIAGDGKLTEILQAPTQGKTPRHFAIDPAGKFLLAENQDSDNIVTFAIDSAKGTLTPTGQITECGAPVCMLFY